MIRTEPSEQRQDDRDDRDDGRRSPRAASRGVVPSCRRRRRCRRPAAVGGHRGRRLGERAPIAPARRHQQADLLALGGRSVDERDDLAAVHHARPGRTAPGPRRARPTRAGSPRPASRLAMTWRWMNSMLPTSRPRVGWSRIEDGELAAELAGDDRLLLVAAGQRAGGAPSADGVRMSYSAMACLAHAWIAASLRSDAARVRRLRRTGSGRGCPRAGS